MADEEKRDDDSPEEKAAESESTESKDVAESKGSADPNDSDSRNEAGAPDDDHDHGHDEHDHDGHDHDGHDHDGHGHGGHEDHDEHLGHTAPISLLVGVLIALGMLTILTVAVTAIDLGGQGNFVVAMVIATVKAILVMGYFMHMFWDAKFNVVAFTSSFLFVLLFLAMAVLDRAEYQDDLDQFEVDQKVQAM